MKKEIAFAAVRIVDRGDGAGVDVATFAGAYWPHRRSARMNSAAGGLLSRLVRIAYVTRYGRGRHARYVATPAGRAFVANLVQRMRRGDTW